MKDLVAKRYVKALVDGRDLNSVALISEKLNEVSKAFKSDKFNSILASSGGICVAVCKCCKEASFSFKTFSSTNAKLLTV